MANTASLVVEIRANAKKLQQSLSKNQNRIRQFAKKAAKNLAILATVGVGAVTAAFAKLTATVFDTSTELDKMIKTANNLGIAAAELQKLEFQAGLSGVSVGELTNSLRQMTRVLGDAGAGSKSAKDALSRLGLSLDALRTKPVSKQFELISERLRQIKDRTAQASIANVLFGRNWLAISNLVRADLKESSKEFDSFGIALTKSQADAIEKFEDSRLKLATLWDGFKQQVTANVAPAFESILTSIKENIVQWGGLREVAQKVAQFLVEAADRIQKAFTGVLNTVDRLIIGFNRVLLLKNNLLKFNEVANPIRLAINKFSDEDPESFLAAEKNKTAIRNAQARIAARNRFSAGLSDKIQRAKLEITVNANKDAFVEKLKTSGDLDSIINTAVGTQVQQAETQVNR